MTSRCGMNDATPRRRALVVAAVFVFACPPLAWPQATLPPVDQATAVPDFFSFRAQLQAAVARRDADAVLSVLSKDVKLSFGGDAGSADFKTLWKPDAPDSVLWETLATVLALGGTFAADGTFTAPYVFAAWPEDRDAFSFMAAIGSGIRVRSAPSSTAPVVDALDFAIVEIVEPTAADAKWVRIRLPPDRIGFVDRRLLRSPIDYRINFAKLDGRWQVVSFLAGD